MVKQRPDRSGKQPERQGSKMSTKQVARTVLDGKPVTFRISADPDDIVSGYVFGMDDFHWAVVEPSGQEHLVHKSAPVVTPGKDSSFEDEPERDELEKLVGPFRRWVEQNLFGRAPTDPARDEDERESAAC